MAVFVFKKLVRDLVPDMFCLKGHEIDVHPLQNEALGNALLEKLQEEVKELHEEKTQEGRLQELADVWEVLDALVTLWQIEPSLVEKARLEKVERLGAFDKGLYIKTVKIREDFPDDLAYLRAQPHKYQELDE